MTDYLRMINARRRTLGAYCFQDWDELGQLAERVDAMKPQVVVEIGSCEFGWCYLMAPYFAPGATVIGIDPLVKNIIRREKVAEVRAKIKGEGYDVRFLEGRSDDDETMKRLIWILDGRKIDLLHIDGAHDYDAVMADWNDYSGLMRKGGLVAFHDVNSRASGEKVYRVWDEIVEGGRFETEVLGNLKRVGIGIVRI